MRKLTLTLIIFSLVWNVYAQNSWDVYKSTYGIPEITPSKTIVPNRHGGSDLYQNTVVRFRGNSSEISPQMQVFISARYLSIASRAGCPSALKIDALSCKSFSNKDTLVAAIVNYYYDVNICQIFYYNVFLRQICFLMIPL